MPHGCLRTREGRAPQYFLYDALRHRAEASLRLWEERCEALKSASDVRRYAEQTKQAFRSAIDEFPQRTP